MAVLNTYKWRSFQNQCFKSPFSLTKSRTHYVYLITYKNAVLRKSVKEFTFSRFHHVIFFQTTKKKDDMKGPLTFYFDNNIIKVII